MKQSLIFLKYILFWMLVFSIQRLLFFINYFERFKEIKITEELWIFVKGLRLDLSMTGYFLLIPIVIFIISILFKKSTNPLKKTIHYYTYTLLFIVILLGIIDLSIYKEWGSKLNSRAVEFLILSPGEAFASSSSSPVFLSTVLFISQFVLFIFIYKKYFSFDFDVKSHLLIKIISVPVFAFLSVMMLRGGLQLAPINQSAAYFSKEPIVNHASLNTEWNLMHSVIENHFSNDNPYVFMDEADASKIVDSLYSTSKTDSSSILKTQRPNIVFIILESYTSDVIEYFGGEKAVAPTLSKLASEGLSFSNIYASGDRTDKGMIAILSGFPTQAVRTIIQQPDKFEKLPAIPKTLGKNGYNTSFYYGGESEFANFKSYLIASGIEKIIDKNNFESNQMNSKWGAHDGYLFEKAIKEIPSLKEPFISVLLTLSSHEPFEIPVNSPYTGDDLPSKFRKAAHYTDQCISDFMSKAKKEDWYKNTLFVIVADHGHRLPKEYETAYDVRKFRIPLILFGDVIKEQYKSKNITKIGSQTDIAATLLHQLNIRENEYEWSKNLLDEHSNDFAFYTYDNGLGWIDNKQQITMDNVTKVITSRSNIDSNENIRVNTAKAYLQKVFSRYLAY